MKPRTNFSSPSSSIVADKGMAIMASYYSAIYGNPRAFTPRWFLSNPLDYFLSYNWNYLYDIAPLKNTLRKYIDL